MDDATYHDPVRYLEHYQVWRQGHDPRSMAEAGIEPQRITWAMNEVLREIKRQRVELLKCRKKRREQQVALMRKKTEEGKIEDRRLEGEKKP